MEKVDQQEAGNDEKKELEQEELMNVQTF